MSAMVRRAQLVKLQTKLALARGTAHSRRNVLGEGIVVLRCWPLLPLSAALALAAVISTVAFAQPAPTSNYTTFEATSAKPVQLGYYASANKDCAPAPLPKIRVVATPKSGTVTVRPGELKTDQVAGCPGLKTPAQVVFYQARAGAVGTDHVVYEVTTSTGEVATYDVTINIREAPKPSSPGKDQKI